MLIPDKAYPFDKDIIDEMMDHEDSLIFNKKKNHHDPHCKFILKNEIKNCCQPIIKNFNKYNQQSYLNQQLELPFEIQ